MMDCRMKILIEYDGSRRADDAIEDLQNAGLPREAKAKIVSVVRTIIPTGMPEIPWSVVYAQVTEREVRQARLAVGEACERLGEIFPDWELDCAVYQGNTELGIIELAAKWKPDLVVIGSRSRNDLGRLIFGSISRSIVERSSCSVRVVRPADIDDGSGLRLLIGFDGSSGSAAAVREVASRRWPRGAQVRLVAGFKSSLDLRSDPSVVAESLLRMRLEVAVGMLRAERLVVSRIIKEGSPRQAILDEAVSYGAHCIFLSGDDYSGFRRLVFGGTAAAVASKAQCTVEVVREKERPSLAIYSGARRRVPVLRPVPSMLRVAAKISRPAVNRFRCCAQLLSALHQ
jgi:nucleotide-binding universal stress UspA family protein